jgi:NADH-quinone oxidoreductase subunit F
MCYDDVQVTLQRPGKADVTWGRVEPGQAAAVVQVATGHRAAAMIPGAFVWTPDSQDGLPGLSDVPFLGGQLRMLLERVGRVLPADLDEALARGVYRGLARALSLPPEAVIDEVRRAGLAGRGGAYFPTAVKWELARRGAPPRYLVVNAEEGEPGVYKDRHLLEGDPHRVVEGALIAAYAFGAERVFIYVNGLAPLARDRIAAAVQQAARHGLVGAAILGSAFSCDIEIREGAGGYVLGEESVLLESIEGRRPMPRVRPPQPVAEGLWGRPTVINNVETLANAGLIVDRGADWFAGLGTPGATGTKLVSVSGNVARPGLVEVPLGTTVRQVLTDLAGGVPDGRALQAILTGGPSGNLVPADRLDALLEPRSTEVLLGSGNLVALDDRQSLLEAVRRLTRFNAEESCGKCTPCREGVSRMRDILERLGAGAAHADDAESLRALCEIAASASLCGLGKMAPNPVASALRHFPLAVLGAIR